MPTPETRTDQEAIDRVRQMVAGDLEPPNEFVAYKVEQARQLQAEQQALVNNIRQLEQQLAQMSERMVSIKGQMVQCSLDIRTWDKEAS